MTAPVGEAFQAVVRAFGPRFVSWVLNMELFSEDNLGEISISPQQALVITQLWSPALAINKKQNSMERDVLRKNLLNAPLNDLHEEAPPTAMRRSCGGNLPNVDDDDVVMHLVLQIVRDLFSTTLMREESPETATGGTGVAHAHGLRSSHDLVDAVLRDDDLSQLFPDSSPQDLAGSDRYNVQSYVKWASGRSGSYQLVMMPDALATFALTLGRIRKPGSINAALGAAREGVQAARRLARGEETEVPLVAIVGNLTLADPTYIDFGDGGVLYPLDDASDRFAPPGSNAFVTPMGEQIVQITGYGSGTDWMEVERSWSEDEQRSARDRYISASRRLNGMRLALILSSPTESVICPVVEQWFRLNPLMYGTSWVVLDQLRQAPFPSVELTSDIRMSAVWWLQRLGNIDTSSLDIGIRRLISAVTARVDPLDGFIDAVMCWENLFSGTPETTFKVCGSIAKLLEPTDLAVRERTMKEATSLYGARSSLVHGANEPDTVKRDKLRDDSVVLAIRCLVEVLQDNELLTRRTSSLRSRYVLLGI